MPVLLFMSTYETITVERRGAVAVLTINRPDKLNALNKQVHADAVVALDELRPELHEVILILWAHAVERQDAKVGAGVAQALENGAPIASARCARAFGPPHVHARERDLNIASLDVERAYSRA